jgi:lysophospholipase L1-like esterase
MSSADADRPAAPPPPEAATDESDGSDGAGPVHVWCYGDSLTEGMSRHEVRGGMAFYPYSDFLPEFSNGRLIGHCCGVSGETTEQILDRLASDKAVAGTQTTHPKYVVLLGGTNDVAHRVSVNEILGMLTTMATEAKRYGALPVFVSIPPLGARFPAGLGGPAAATRAELNAKIATVAAETFDRAPYVELHDAVAIARDKVTDDESAAYPVYRPEFDADGLHMTKAGYQLQAKLIAEAIVADLAAKAAPA